MGFFATGLGTAVLLIGQSLLIVAFVMISLLMLVLVFYFKPIATWLPGLMG